VTGSLQEKQYFLIISRSVVLRTRNISYKLFRENQNIRFMFRNLFSNVVPLMR